METDSLLCIDSIRTNTPKHGQKHCCLAKLPEQSLSGLELFVTHNVSGKDFLVDSMFDALSVASGQAYGASQGPSAMADLLEMEYERRIGRR